MLLQEVGNISFPVFYISILGTMLYPEDEDVIDAMLKCDVFRWDLSRADEHGLSHLSIGL
jgi:hypothetical protein